MKKRVRKERERKRWEGVEGKNRIKKEEIFFHIILGMKKKLKKNKKS